MVQHCNTVNKQTSVIFLHHTIKKLRKGFERKEYCRRKCQREQVQAENLLHVMRQEVHPGAGCVNKVARHAGLRYHRLCIQHKCQHLCSHRSGTAENFSSPGFCQGTLFFLIQGFQSQNSSYLHETVFDLGNRTRMRMQRIRMLADLRELRSSGASRMYQKMRISIFEARREWHENRSICT